MDEYSRIVIERYCRSHPKTKKSGVLWDLVQMSYSLDSEPTDKDAIDLERIIARDKDWDDALMRISQSTTLLLRSKSPIPSENLHS